MTACFCERTVRACLVIVLMAALVAFAAPRAAAARFWARDGAQANGTRVVIDDVGRRVVMPAQVNRIVTLAPNLTETVYALGLGDKLVGDTDLCDTPPAAAQKPHVGNPQDPSLEAIVALRPDLVLATTSINVADTADALARLGIAVYTTAGDTQTMLEMLDSMAKMSDLMGAGPQGTAFVAHLRARLDALHARLASLPIVHVLFVVWQDPLITIGQKTFIADALRWAGAESIVDTDNNWPQLSMEEVVRLQPDYIVFAGGHGDTAASELAALRARAVWRDLDAVKQGHVVNLSEESIRPSPGLVDAIERLAREVHPEAFSEKDEIRNTKVETRLASGIAQGAGASAALQAAERPSGSVIPSEARDLLSAPLRRKEQIPRANTALGMTGRHVSAACKAVLVSNAFVVAEATTHKAARLPDNKKGGFETRPYGRSRLPAAGGAAVETKGKIRNTKFDIRRGRGAAADGRWECDPCAR